MLSLFFNQGSGRYAYFTFSPTYLVDLASRTGEREPVVELHTQAQ